ncbi:MAG: sulfatase-like hydrolase/transferase, partial [Bacteroidales bacterium]|nr:sulfatase-like hydrolase/transferase [Bacteroidales bacterium]
MKTKRTHLLLMVFTALAFSLLLSCSVQQKNEQPPNILFIFIDDMGYGDLGCYGNLNVHTPNIDKLAAEGILFRQFYVNAPICSPSRVAVTTGQYPSRWGITTFISGSEHNEERGISGHLDISAPSVARELQKAGYYTAHIGKWHMGGGRDIGDVPLITEYGFDESVTQFEGLGERYLATYETLGLADSTRGLEKQSAAL